MQQSAKTGLVRAIRRWDLIALTINAVIGGGIFGLPSRTFSLIGSYSLFAFFACALVVALIIFCFAEVGSRFSETGGPYIYAQKAFGSQTGFIVGWLVYLARLTSFAAICNLLLGYVGFFYPPVESGLLRIGIISLIVVTIALVNIRGVRGATVMGNFFTVGKLTALLLFIAVGFFFINPQNFDFQQLPSYGDFSKSVLLLIYAFTGFEMAVIPSGEIENPRRDIPIAMLSSITIIALIYFSIQFVCIGTLPDLEASSRPLADASLAFFGTTGASIISLGALISIIGNLHVTVLSGSRLPFAMATRQQLPQILAQTHPVFHTPHVSIVVTSLIMLVLTISGTFVYALTISAIARLLAFATTCTAVIVFRRQEQKGEQKNPALFKAPFGILMAITSLILAVWLLSNSSLDEAVSASLAIIAGFIIYYGYRIFKNRRAGNE